MPSVLGLIKCLNTASNSVKYHPMLVNTLLKSTTDRFGGIMDNLQMPQQPHTGQFPASLKPFSDKLNFIAAAMDPNYGFV